MNKWYVYIVECADGSLYTGISTDVQRRLLEHNFSSKGAKYARSKRPVRLVWSKEVADRSEASIEEYRIKKLSRKKKLVLIKS